MALEGAEVALYDDIGVWDDGLVAIEHFLDWKGVSHERISGVEVNSTELGDLYQILWIPGGNAYYYSIRLNAVGRQNIRDLVDGGGSYIGSCAGAYYASDLVSWEGEVYDYPLNLFAGTAFGAIDEIAPWPGYSMTTINLNSNHPINQFEPSSQVTMYYGGAAFFPHEGVSVDTVATYSAYDNNCAEISFSYGEGRVLLLGPHPEIEEDSNRDGTAFGDGLNDQGSDWNFLWSALDWALGHPITNPELVPVAEEDETLQRHPLQLSQNFPNPFNPSTTISFQLDQPNLVDLRIFDISGKLQRVLLDRRQLSTGRKEINWNGKDQSGKQLPAGTYFYRLSVGKHSRTLKMVLVK